MISKYRNSNFASAFVIGLAVVTTLATPHAFAQQLRRTEEQSTDGIAISSLVISVITFGGAVPVVNSVRSNLRDVKSRNGFQSEPVLNQPFGLPQEISIIDDMLKGTAPGDVIRLEYTVNQPRALEIAVTELKQSSNIWEKRVQELKATGEALEVRIDAVPKTRENAVQVANLQKELKNLAAVYQDAEMRFAAIRASYRRASPALRTYQQNGSMFGMRGLQFQITRDILVDGDTRKVLESAFKKYNVKLGAVRGLNFKDIKITKTYIPNESLAARSLMRARGGLVAAGAMGALIAEEMIVGYLGRQIDESLRDQPSPETRTVPRAPIGSTP